MRKRCGQCRRPRDNQHATLCPICLHPQRSKTEHPEKPVTGISIAAVYTVTCDGCGVRAEPDSEHHTYMAAIVARQRVSEFDGWLLRWPASCVPELWCPECVAAGKCRDLKVTSNDPIPLRPRSGP